LKRRQFYLETPCLVHPLAINQPSVWHKYGISYESNKVICYLGEIVLSLEKNDNLILLYHEISQSIVVKYKLYKITKLMFNNLFHVNKD